MAEPTPDSFCAASHAPVFTKPIVASMVAPIMRKAVNSKLAIDDNKHDCTSLQVQDAEYKNWHDDESKDWDLYQKHRPYSSRGYAVKAPQVGDVRDGVVLTLAGTSSTLLAEVKKLGEEQHSPVVAVSFDSVSCPVWRTFGGQDLHNAAASRGVPVLHVYTKEAHATDEFPAGPNGAGPIALTRQIAAHKTVEERIAAAREGLALISKQVGDATMVIDNMDNTLETAYEARPFRLYLLETQTGKVVLAGGMCPFNIPAKVADVQAFDLSNLLSARLAQFRSCADVKDHKYHLHTYKDTFVGSEAVSQLVAKGFAKDREAAEQIGKLLVGSGLVEHVTKQHGFRDKKYFYRFL